MSPIVSLFKKKEYFGMRSFTYFIPSPPSRKTGYQEKEFDQVFSYLMKKQYDVLELKTESISSSDSSGMWIICILGAKTQEAYEANIEIDYQDISNKLESTIKLHPDIEHE